MSNEKILALDKKLSAQRNEWSVTIRSLAQSLRNINTMEVTIADVLSSRQTLVDQMAYINVKIKQHLIMKLQQFVIFWNLSKPFFIFPDHRNCCCSSGSTYPFWLEEL